MIARSGPHGAGSALDRLRAEAGMGRFADSMTLAEARAGFFAVSGLGQDGGYGARWVRVESRPVPFYFPNTACRVAAARLHDLHHIATGYATDWTGEAEIAAWEIASGCGRYGWAWILNLGAFTVGLVRSPRRTFHACGRDVAMFVAWVVAAMTWYGGLAAAGLVVGWGVLRGAGVI